jgi:thiopeptide-type bacteriocin biosynthesis protein
LYRPAPLDRFLTDAVRPLVESVFEEHLASAFFFIRYWEGGSHVRLRFRTTDREPLARRTRAHFESYFEAYPSAVRTDPPASHMPTDCVREIAYEPEVTRYGGTKGIVASERQFEASSRAILAAMAGREWSYESAIGVAVQLHIMFASTMGFDLRGAAEFFATVSENFGKTTGWLPPGMTNEDAVRQFAALFAIQRERLVALHREVWSASKERARFAERWANRWLRDNDDVARRLRRARGISPGEPWTGIEHAIMTSYVHMTNNRLGVMNRDEAYVAYLLMRGFREVT